MQNVRASALPPGPCKCLSNPVIMAKNMKENVLGKNEKKSKVRHNMVRRKPVCFSQDETI